MQRPQIFNVYCDESCHLEGDSFSSMVLGCIWCPEQSVRRVSEAIRGIKAFHGLATQSDYSPPAKPFESKWTKVSDSKVDFYTDLVEYFFKEDDVYFRGILVRDKLVLDHAKFNQSHDDWYYKMMFILLDRIVVPDSKYSIYLDIKDTRSEHKRSMLEAYLRRAARDSDGSVIRRVQQIRSHESEIMQLADLMIGAISFKNRLDMGDLGRDGVNQGKLKVCRLIQRLSGKSLSETTWQGEKKFNLLAWESEKHGGAV